MKRNLKQSQGRRLNIDVFFRRLTLIAGCLCLLILAGFFWELIWQSRLSIQKFGLAFIWTKEWNPVTQEFGALSSIYGTVVSTVIAMLIGLPASFFVAFFLSELCPRRLVSPLRSGVELLAAIPSIIYGMWGLFVFAPIMADHIQPFLEEKFGFIPFFQGPPMGIGMLPAGIILAIMILPFMTSVMLDVFRMTPRHLREAAYGMGSTRWEVMFKIILPYGFQGILGCFFIGLGRALGETMAVTFVIGNNHTISAALFEPGNTIASTLANEFAEASEPIYLSALIEMGLILLVITFILNAIAQLWLEHHRKRWGGNR